ncbi:hypothetical protein QTJ16_002517 [Diplocarpon rosae]|uniref:Secreted protein n=1 Tax=Diplocarpon rosae TaxID=946125 RepID=A0AAD9WG18_9HELO|nr:hypothetical protein QTJ16_002517 [Diplocarpon rosae]
MKTVTLATIIISSLIQFGAATNYKVSCERATFGGVPDDGTALQTATNVCVTGLSCTKVGSVGTLTGSPSFKFTCISCESGLGTKTVHGCTNLPQQP